MPNSIHDFVNTPQEPQETMLPVGAATTPYRSIAVTDIEPGQGDTIATFNVKIGSVLIRSASLRRGRGDSTYVNYHSRKNQHGRWIHLIEILSPALESAVREEIYRAVGEVVMSEFTLTHYDAIRTAIVQAHSIDEVKDIRDKAEAIRQYARQAKLGIEDINRVAQIKLRAERRGGELLAAIPPAQGKRTDLTSSIVEEVTRAQAIQAAGISVGDASRWQLLAELPEPVFDQHIDAVVAGGDELTTAHMMRKVQEFRRGEKRAAMSQPGAFPAGIYRVWYADPPWQMNDNGVKTKHDSYGVAERHYPTVSTPDLCAMGQQWAGQMAKDSVLFLWATVPMLPEGLSVMEAWGFTYKTQFVWDKRRHVYGHYSSVQHELLLLGTRGSCLPDIDDPIRSVQEFPRGKHSAKPAEWRELIDTLYPYGPRIELFARGELPERWQGWGNEVVR